MNKYNLIAAFEDAVVERDASDDSETIELYDAAREALADAIVENNPALAAIQYALEGDNHEWDSSNQLKFLELWSEGEFETLRNNWENIPDEVFIGADTQFVPKEDE